MKRCTIFCAGDFHGLAAPIDHSMVIAADGGLRHLQALNIQPDVVLGDFDSLGYTPTDARVFPVEKDDTDSMLAVRHGLDAGCRSFILYGALDGPRLDHTIANLQTLMFLAQHGASGTLVGKDHIVTVVKDGAIRLPAQSEGIVSLFCMGEDAKGVTIKNLQYELENGTLSAAFPLAVSNHFIGKEALIQVQDGALLLIYPRSVGII